MTHISDIAFTDSVKQIQTRKGSRTAYANVAQQTGWNTEITQELEDFLAEQNSLFMATVNAQGYPYIQHRGGPRGFLKALDKHTLAFADYKGNRQFISQGNLLENPKTNLFLIDYRQKKRIKIWGTAKMVEDDPALLDSLMPDSDAYRAKPEQVFVFNLEVWDRNCPQHIPVRLDADVVEQALSERDAEIAQLKLQLKRLLTPND